MKWNIYKSLTLSVCHMADCYAVKYKFKKEKRCFLVCSKCYQETPNTGIIFGNKVNIFKKIWILNKMFNAGKKV
jgi:hypothetical protein